MVILRFFRWLFSLRDDVPAAPPSTVTDAESHRNMEAPTALSVDHAPEPVVVMQKRKAGSAKPVKAGRKATTVKGNRVHRAY